MLGKGPTALELGKNAPTEPFQCFLIFLSLRSPELLERVGKGLSCRYERSHSLTAGKPHPVRLHVGPF